MNFENPQPTINCLCFKCNITTNSKIVVSEKEFIDLMKMLQDHHARPIQQMNLLYRASQNEFSTYRFHQKCDMIEHTVTLVQTEYGKKIGGYTPLMWTILREHDQPEVLGNSFIFSLSNNHKFNLKKGYREISNYPTNGPDFNCFMIGNKTNTNNSSQVNTFYVYTHPEYEEHSKQSIRKFIGTSQAKDYFKVKQWQVFALKLAPSTITNSKIVVSGKELFDLKKMLEDQQNTSIKELSLLYRASQHEFNIQVFHRKCDSIEHTVTLIETINGKKIGGYTPLMWNTKRGVNNYEEDPSGKTFIFSLTNNHKFTLSNPKKAIQKSSFMGPSFGDDIVLFNQADRFKDSYSLIGDSYFHPQYQKSQKETVIKFTGDFYFQVKQWQVYAVKWE